VIKTTREHLDLGMAEAKHLVDSAPCVLTRAMEGARAKSFFEALVHAGAKAHVI
jgi:ribosomal protein L7/L12